MDAYFAGKKLYGDDFTPEQIERWFAQEKELYAEFGAGDREHYIYYYHEINRRHGFRYLPDKVFEDTLSIGGAYCDELLPLAEAGKLRKVTVLEPSQSLRAQDVGGVPLTYLTPDPSGKMPFEDASFDLVSCMSTLHHIPNVSFLVREMYRVLRSNGYCLMREPVNSMGDWRKPRPGLSPNERGIPIPLFRQIIEAAGFRVVKETRCFHPLTKLLCFKTKLPLYNLPVGVTLDSLFCTLLDWSRAYHAQSKREQIRPQAVYYVTYKP